jgi:penicillin amidase
MRKKAKTGFFVLILLIFIGFGLFCYVFWKTDSFPEDKIVLDGPHGKVTITKDKYGVPHIVALTSDLDVFFALGYIHAKDRLWQMELDRHIVQGRLSEIFGKATVVQDEYLRTWGFYRAAQQSWRDFSPQTQAIIQSYTLGINTYLKKNKMPLQLLFLKHKPEPWTAIDSFVWAKMLAWQLQNSWQDKIRNYLLSKHFNAKEMLAINAPYPDSAPVVLSDNDLVQAKILPTQPEMQADAARNINASVIKAAQIETKVQRFLNIKNVPGKGSNNWVVAGKFTKSGFPLLANDTHLEFSAPDVWYLAELKGPNLHVTGATLTGLPAIVIGHNDHIAWGVTDASIDAQDIYLIPDNTKTKIIHELINIKNAQPINYNVEIAPDGSPVISSLFNPQDHLEKMAISWVGLQANDMTVQSFLNLNYAQNWQEFTNSLKDFVAPALSFVYADTTGNIGYYLAGRIPIRNGSGAYPFHYEEKYLWAKYIPFEQLPHVYNPPEGFIASANNKIISGNYPYSLTYRWRGMPYRIERITELSKANLPMDVSTAIKIQMDLKSQLWQTFSPVLVPTVPLDEQSKHALALLQSWDGTASTDSVAATVFAFWLQELSRLQPHPPADVYDMSNPLFIYNQLATDGDFCKINHFKDCQAFLSSTLQTAVQRLVEKYGINEKNWRWGKVHHAVFNDPIFGNIKLLGWIWNRSIATGGDNHTINAGSYDETFNHVAGATYREIIDLGNLKTNYFMVPLGQSGNALSAHYSDLMVLWRDGSYIPMEEAA